MLDDKTYQKDKKYIIKPISKNKVFIRVITESKTWTRNGLFSVSLNKKIFNRIKKKNECPGKYTPSRWILEEVFMQRRLGERL